MPLKRSTLVVSGSDLSDFSINTGSSGNTTATLSKDFPAGKYVIVSDLGDTAYDIYFVASDGSAAGSVNATSSVSSITATKSFNTVVIYGAMNNDILTFSYRYVFTPSADDSSITAVGPRIVSLSTNVLPNINDPVTITGKNFATDVQVSFVGSDNVSRPAKSATRNSSTELVVVRPDSLPTDYEPYTIIVSNPGITSPSSTNLNRVGSLDAGTAPTWTTSAGDLATIFTKGASLSQSLSASDSDAGGGVTYSIVSGSLPSGLSLNSSTGTISGTASSAFTGRNNLVIRATDAGGNYVERSFTLINNPTTESDTFNRTTSGNLGSTDSSQASVWVNTKGTWQANGTKATSSDSIATNAIATIDMAKSDITNLQVDTDNTGGVGLAFWTTDANSWFATTVYHTFSSGTGTTCASGWADAFGSYPAQCCGGYSTQTWYKSVGQCNDGYAWSGTWRADPYSGPCGGSRGGLAFAYSTGETILYKSCTQTTQSYSFTNYDSQFRIINNGTNLVDTLFGRNSSSYTTAGSIAISTSGNTISYSVYSGTNKTGSVIHSGSYTAVNPTKGTRVGVYKGDGGTVQGSSVDNFSITV